MNEYDEKLMRHLGGSAVEGKENLTSSFDTQKAINRMLGKEESNEEESE